MKYELMFFSKNTRENIIHGFPKVEYYRYSQIDRWFRIFFMIIVFFYIYKSL